MTTPAQLSAQIVDLMTRWNAQQDQMADWLTGDPAGGPNGDGRYPLTNAEGETELFLSLPAILDQVSGPAAAAASAQQAAETAAALAEAARIAAQAAQSAANDIRSTTLGYRDVVQVQRDDVAAKWSDVNFWYGQVNARQLEVATATTLSLQYRDESQQNALDALAARVAAEEARDAAYGYAISIDPAQFATTATVDARFEEIIGQAPSTLDTLNELAAALGDDPNFATTVTNSLAGKAPLVHGHVIGDVSGLQTALDGKAALSHVHTIAQVTGLQAVLDGKFGLEGGALSGGLSVFGGVTAGNQTNASADSGFSILRPLDATPRTFAIVENDTQLRIGGGAWTQINLWAGAARPALTAYETGAVTIQTSLTVAGRDVLNDIDGKAALAHTHAISAVTGLQAALDGKLSTASFTWANLSGKPATFTPSAHTHAISEVTGLQAALDGKQAVGSYAAAAHTHPISDVTGLQSALDGKLNISGGSGVGNVAFSQESAGGVRFGHTNQTDGNDGIIAAGRFASGLNIVGVQTTVGTGRQVRVWGDLIDSAGVAFSKSGHTHTIAQVTGLQTALDGKLNLTGGTLSGALSVPSGFTVRKQGNEGGEMVLQKGDMMTTSGDVIIDALAGYIRLFDNGGSFHQFRLEFATGNIFSSVKNANVSYEGHTHTIAQVTGLQAALDGKQAAGSYAAASHTHAYLPLTGGTLSGTVGAPRYNVGDDGYFADINAANTVAFRGAQNTDVGYINFGNGGNALGSGVGLPLTFRSGGVAYHGSSSYGSAKITVSTAAPSGGSSGDIWLKV
jgi:hypothetical protein